ncbi:cytochrome c oxidase subunit II [bacterium]|nr:cytochrome c oxidase subunit II [bacterium]
MEIKFIIIITVALFFIALVQLMKIYDLAAKVRGEKSQEKVSRSENMLMANLMLVFMVVFFGFVIWLISKYGSNSGLYTSATIHGREIDELLMFNWWIILPVFFITNTLLFGFSWKYYHREERTALYYPHNNKLEAVWTIVPAIVLAFIVIYGLMTWNKIMYNQEKGEIVEVYGYQFGWIVRYSGVDNTLGKADYKMVSATNPLGVITESTIKDTYLEIDQRVNDIDSILSNNINDDGEYLLPESKVDKLQEELDRHKRRKYRIEASIDRKENNVNVYESSNDDIIVQEIHLVKDQPYTFKFRSKDVIHCPWFPHFRAQINAVPGMETSFALTPTITTDEMRADPDVQKHWENINVIHNERKRRIGEEEERVLFDYVLMCNKICGAGHSNMQLKVIVETQEEFNNWIENNGDNKRLTFSGQEVSWSKTKEQASL